MLSAIRVLASAFIRISNVLSQVIASQNHLTFHMIALERRQKELEKRINELSKK